MLDKTQTSCKICDFGLAVTNEKKGAKGKEGHVGDIKSTRGSPLWMAPERVAIKVMGDDELRDSLGQEVANYTKSVKVTIFFFSNIRLIFDRSIRPLLILLKRVTSTHLVSCYGKWSPRYFFASFCTELILVMAVR